jgi:V8-like Glu-specific endopeptidase
MRSFVAAIALTTMAFLTCGSPAKERIGGGGYISILSLPRIGAHDPRIRVDPNAVPWRAIGKLQAASLNLRETCTATLVGPSTVVTAAHCVFNRRTQRNFPLGRCISLLATTGTATPATQSGSNSRLEMATIPPTERDDRQRLGASVPRQQPWLGRADPAHRN